MHPDSKFVGHLYQAIVDVKLCCLFRLCSWSFNRFLPSGRFGAGVGGIDSDAEFSSIKRCVPVETATDLCVPVQTGLCTAVETATDLCVHVQTGL